MLSSCVVSTRPPSDFLKVSTTTYWGLGSTRGLAVFSHCHYIRVWPHPLLHVFQLRSSSTRHSPPTPRSARPSKPHSRLGHNSRPSPRTSQPKILWSPRIFNRTGQHLRRRISLLSHPVLHKLLERRSPNITSHLAEMLLVDAAFNDALLSVSIGHFL